MGRTNRLFAAVVWLACGCSGQVPQDSEAASQRAVEAKPAALVPSASGGGSAAEPAAAATDLDAQLTLEDPRYAQARSMADRAALKTQRAALAELQRARRGGGLSVEQAAALDQHIAKLEGRIAQREQRVAAAAPTAP